MALIHILDKQSDKIIGTLNLGEYTDDEKVLSSENENTFDFTALKKFDLLQKRNRLLLQDKDGFYSEYIIIYAEQNSRNQKFIKSNATFTDLQKAKIIEPQTLQGATADTATTKALEGTEWRKGKVDYNGIRTLKIEEYTNPYSMLKIIASEFGLDLRFRVAVEGNKIVRYVDLTFPDDEFDGKEVVFGKDLIGLRRIEDAQNIVTTLLVLGPEKEDGTRLTVLVEDNDALQRWGRNGQHLIEVYEPQITAEDVTIERLRTLGQNALQKRIDAIVTYECQAAILEYIPGKEHEKIRLDRTLRIKDEGYTPPLYVEAKVLEVKEQPSTGKILDFKLGNYKEFSKADLEAQIAGLKKLLAQKASNAKLVETYELALQQAEEKAAQAESNAKGYTDTVKVEVVEHANTVANQAENNAKSHADTVAEQAESKAKAYALSEADKARIAAIQAAATDAQTKVNAAKTALEVSIAEKADAQWVNGQLVLKENAITKSSTAPSNPTVGQLWLDTSVTPNVLKRWSGSAWVKATPTSAGEVGAYTKTEVDNALNSKVSVTQYTTDMNGVVTRLNSAESRITQTENEIATKVSSTQYQQDLTTVNNNISQLTTRMGQTETELQQTSSQIALKANKTDVYTKTETDNKFTSVNQQISQLDAELSVQADKIATKVSKTEFESLQVGGKNLLLNTRDWNGWTAVNGNAYKTSNTYEGCVVQEQKADWSYLRITSQKQLIASKTYTASVWLKASVGGILTPYYSHESFPNIETRILAMQSVDGDTKVTTEWKRWYVTFVANGTNHISGARVEAQGFGTSGAILYVAGLKLEEGNRPTTWTPAPEDVQGQIDGLGTRVNSAESSITSLSTQIQSKVSQTTFESQMATKTNASDVYTKNEVDSKLANGDIYLRGTGLNRDGARILKVNGNTIYNTQGGRGLRLVTIRRSDLSIVEDITYDIYGSDQARTELANKLNSLDDSVIVTLTSYDAIQTNDVLDAAIKRCGGTGKRFGGSFHRVPYALVGIPGIEENSGIEIYTSTDSNAPMAEIYTKVINGTPQGINTIGQNLGTRVSSAETSITQLSNQIQLKAEQSTVDTLANRISSAESTLTIHTDQIASKVSQTTFESALSGKENTVYKQNTAPAHANGRFWLDTSKTPNVLYRSNGSAWIKVTPTSAGEVGAFSQADGDTLAGRLSTAESTITQQADLISQKVSKTDYNGNTIASLINQTATTIKLQAAKIELDGYVEAKHIKSLAGLNVNDQFVVDSSGNATFGGKLNGATGTFSGSITTPLLVIGDNDITGYEEFGLRVQTAQWQASTTEPFIPTGHIVFNTLNNGLEIYQIDNSGQEIRMDYFLVNADTTNFNGDLILDGGAILNGGNGGFIINSQKGQSAVWWDNNTSCGWSYWSSAWWRFNYNANSFEATNYAGTAYKPITASGWNTSSKAELKTDIKKWEESALEKIRNTAIYEYRLKDDESRTVRQGVVIGEGYQLDPSLVDENETIDQYRMNSWSFKAIQELDSEQQGIKDRVAWLETENNYLKQKIALLEAKIS